MFYFPSLPLFSVFSLTLPVSPSLSLFVFIMPLGRGARFIIVPQRNLSWVVCLSQFSHSVHIEKIYTICCFCWANIMSFRAFREGSYDFRSTKIICNCSWNIYLQFPKLTCTSLRFLCSPSLSISMFSFLYLSLSLFVSLLLLPTLCVILLLFSIYPSL